MAPGRGGGGEIPRAVNKIQFGGASGTVLKLRTASQLCVQVPVHGQDPSCLLAPREPVALLALQKHLGSRQGLHRAFLAVPGRLVFGKAGPCQFQHRAQTR